VGCINLLWEFNGAASRSKTRQQLSNAIRRYAKAATPLVCYNPCLRLCFRFEAQHRLTCAIFTHDRDVERQCIGVRNYSVFCHR
jgi:hypothetical protein